MIYKTLKKVSEYCQLLDKRTFETRTEGGTTATYNNDGTFTVSGTATANSWKNFPIFQLLPGGGEHVYLFNVAGISGDTNCYCNIYFYDEVIHSAVELMKAGIEGSAVIKKLETPTVYQARFNITTLTGATPNNIVYKPQLFDLTEMYGAGNEPTTVEEFREKFPNELYDYKPYCFVKSYKNCLKVSDVCQLMVYPYFETTLTRNGITFTDNGDGTITANGTSIGFATFVFSKNFNFIAGNKYYVSTPYSIIAYKENGTMKYAQGNILFTWKSNWEIVQVYMQINAGITVSNLTFKPQIFDLTEMYGAGNEPTTVEQFKADFTNELYDYKPYSIITSYKKSLKVTDSILL